MMGPVLTVLLIAAKFFSKIKFLIVPLLKFLPVLAKTGGTMVLTIWVYAMFWGWKFAAGFVLLIFIHELGHVWAARWMKLPVTAPVFIPFIGAHILMKQMPPNARVEAIVGIGGPIAGTLAALIPHAIYFQTEDAFWLALAYSGYFLNLFNLIPLTPLDGGRIVAALSPWLWIPGLLFVVALMVARESFSPILILILIFAMPKVIGLFRSHTPEENRYYEVAPKHRFLIALSFFGLAGLLLLLKEDAMSTLESIGRWGR
jgi:Zn-dependent protease